MLTRRRSIVNGLLVWLLLAVMIPLAPVAAQADACVTAAEPNDQPADAIDLGSGEACAESANASGGQDLYRWTVEAADATTPWTVTVTGIPGQVVKIEPYTIVEDGGAVVSAEKLTTVDAGVGVSAVISQALFPTGVTLILGVATSGPGAYTLTIERGTAPEEIEPGSVADGFAIVGDQADTADVLTWEVSSDSVWDLTFRKPLGSSGQIGLARADGTSLGQWASGDGGLVFVPRLTLGAGTYTISLAGTDATDGPYALEATEAAVDAVGEAEPNDTAAVAIPLVWEGDAIARTGSLDSVSSAPDRDVYRFAIAADQVNRQLDIRVKWGDDLSRRACLLDSGDREISCQDTVGGATFPDLILAAGDYAVSVSGSGGDPVYLLRLELTREATPGYEAEPNNARDSASALILDGEAFSGSGRLGPNDPDAFRFTVTGEPQLWEIEVRGSGLARVDRLDVTGSAVATANAVDGVAMLYDQFLLPGDHVLSVSGASDLYTIVVRPMGPPDPQAELESNDRADASQLLLPFETRNGRVPTVDDVDYYRFSLQNESHVRIVVTAPEDADLGMDIEWIGQGLAALDAPEPGDDLVYEGVLPVGDYRLRVGATTPSLERYTIALTIEDPFVVPQDREPNDDARRAAPVAWTSIAGISDPAARGSDIDWYLLPPRDGGDVTIDPGDVAQVALFEVDTTTGDAGASIPAVLGTDCCAILASIPDGVPVLLEVRGSGAYTITFDGTEPAPATPVAGDLPLTASLALETTTVAAYWTDSQRIAGTLTLTNSGSADIGTTLEPWLGDLRWSIDLEDAAVTIPGGGTIEIPVSVTAAPDAWADRPVLVAIGVPVGDTIVSATAAVTVDRTAPPVNPVALDPLPGTMLGGLDVAWTGLAAVPDALAPSLTDGRILTGFGWRADLGIAAEATIDLAGDAPVPLTGVVLDPRGMDGSIAAQAKGFAIAVSSDGIEFETVLTGELTAWPGEQAFPFDEVIAATWVRITLVSAQDPAGTQAVLGEFKVIAEPGWMPGGAVNLADPAIGGHVVAMDPVLVDPASFNDVLGVADVAGVVSMASGGTASIVIGFHNDRAARIDAIEVAMPPVDATSIPGIVAIEVATEAPIGPWTPLDVELPAIGAGETAEIALDAPVWARFVRVTLRAQGADDVEETVNAVLPDRIAILEASVSADAPSILGEWGETTATGPYEREHPAVAIALAPDAGEEAATAALLPIGTTLTGSAWVGQDVDWYRVDIPADTGQVTATLGGFPAVDVTADFFDEAGEPIEAEIDEAGGTLTLTATVEPGSSVYLRVAEPPSNVVFAFDTSGSIGALASTVYQALGAYAAAVEPGQEFVNIVPFGNTTLLPEATDQPYLLTATITNYPRSDGSSDADGAIVTSMETLAAQPGTKAIVLITDNETSPGMEQAEKEWSGLATVRPRIVAVHIAGSETSTYRMDVMQDWAMVNGGAYAYVQNQAELDIAFDRAATGLRRPSLYTVVVEASAPAATPTPVPTSTPVPTPTPEATATPTPTPTPEATATSEPTPTPTATAEPEVFGSLYVSAASVEAGETIPAANDLSVAIVLDTSGSMLQELDGQSRAAIAKASLTDLVTTTLPAGTNVSLRTFGDTPGSCESRLVVSQQPLDPDIMAATIDGLPVVNEVRTPIGASLEAVGGDLGMAPGPKIVVLVTDGEETCDGDPAAAIQALVDSGIDVRVNIVGFALEDEALKAQFAEWAQLGNGRYIDAGSAGELTEAIADAVQPTFDVIDPVTGAVIATGQVGSDPIPVPVGIWTVVIRTDVEMRFDDVDIVEDQETWLELP